MVKQKVVIDTNIIIDHLRQGIKQKTQSQLEVIVEDRDIIPLISTATMQELFAGQSSKKAKEERKIKSILALFKTIPVNEETAENAGKIMRDTKPLIQFADAQIAAAAILEKACLLTKNRKDFLPIKGLKLYSRFLGIENDN